MKQAKNPLLFNTLIALVVAAIGILLAIVPRWMLNLNNFYFLYIGCVCAIGGLAFTVYFLVRSAQFKQFIANNCDNADALVWEYTDELYGTFIKEENRQQKDTLKRLALLIAVIVVFGIIVYFIGTNSAQQMSIILLVFAIIVVSLIMFIAPSINRMREGAKPYGSVITDKEAYVQGRYHTWKQAEAHIREYDNGYHIYRVLAVRYENKGLTGKTFNDFIALLPDEKDPNVLKEAKAMADKINKSGKQKKTNDKNEGDALDRLFIKMMGRKDDER